MTKRSGGNVRLPHIASSPKQRQSGDKITWLSKPIFQLLLVMNINIYIGLMNIVSGFTTTIYTHQKSCEQPLATLED